MNNAMLDFSNTVKWCMTPCHRTEMWMLPLTQVRSLTLLPTHSTGSEEIWFVCLNVTDKRFIQSSSNIFFCGLTQKKSVALGNFPSGIPGSAAEPFILEMNGWSIKSNVCVWWKIMQRNRCWIGKKEINRVVRLPSGSVVEGRVRFNCTLRDNL